jgi:hypothetical protein
LVSRHASATTTKYNFSGNNLRCTAMPTFYS